MNVNTSKTKLFAAVAVLAMVVCVFAIAVPAWESDATGGYYGEPVTVKEGITVSLPAGLDGTVNGNKITAVGEAAMAADNKTVDATQNFKDLFGSSAKGYATAMIQGLNKLLPEEFSGNVTVKQTNSALATYGVSGDIQDNNGIWTKTKNTYTSTDIDDYAFLIPKDGSSVTIEVIAGEDSVSYGTYTFDFSGVTTEVTLADGVKGIRWTYTDGTSTLAFNNYTGQEQFVASKALTVTFDGTNVMNVDTACSGANADGAAIYAGANKLTIKSIDADATLTINQKNAEGMGIAGKPVVIGVSGGAETNLNLYGGNRAINADGEVSAGVDNSITINNTVLNATGSERVIRGGDLTINNSTVTAELIDLDPETNNAGDDDRFGVKVVDIVVNANSQLTTEGLRVIEDYSNSGKIIVSGDYAQNPVADIKPVIAGLYIDSATSVSAIRGVPAAPAAGNLYLTGDAQAYNAEVTSGGKVTEVSVSSTETTEADIVNDINNGIKDTPDVTTVTVTLSGDITGLDVESVIDGITSEKVTDIILVATGTSTISSTGELDVTGKSVTLSGFTFITMTAINGGNSAQFNGVSGNITLSEGSVVISGNVEDGTITVDGEVRFDGTATGTTGLTIQTENGADVVIGQGFTVGAGAKVTFTGVTVTSQGPIANGGTINLGTDAVANGLTITGGSIEGALAERGRLTLNGNVLVTENGFTNNGTINLNGTLDGATGAKRTLTNNGVIVIMSKDAGFGDNLTITGTGTVDTSAIASNVDISGSIEEGASYGMHQTVTVVGNTTIVEGANFTIRGTLVINENVTLTIEDGASISMDGVYSSIVNNGTIVIEGADGLSLDGTTVDNNGTVQTASDDDGTTVMTMSNTNFNNKGTFIVSEGNTVTSSNGGGFVNAAGAQLYIYGAFGVTVQNSGAVTVDSESDDVNIIVNQAAIGATVSIVSVDGTVAVNDNGLDYIKGLANYSDVNGVSLTSPASGTIGGVSVSSVLDDVTNTDGSKSYYKRLVISGAADIDTTAENETGAIQVSDEVYVKETFSVTEDVTFSGIAGSELVVSGSMAVEDGSKVTVPTVTVIGDIVSGKKALGSTTINGAMYTVTSVTAQKTYYYTNFADAVTDATAASVNKIEVTGTISVISDVTIPAGMTVDQKNGTMTIGKDATVTVTSGGKINVNDIDVDGTLYVADKSTGTNRNPDVTSEVKSEGEKDVRYTNLRNAIAAAGTVETTIILNGDVEITSDMTIPSNITVDTNGKGFAVKGAKLTIDGTLYLNNTVTGYTVTDVEGNIVKVGSVVVNGYMKSNGTMVYDGKAYPSGAYYSIGLYMYVTSVSNAPNVIAEADGQEVGIYGKNTAGDLAFAGTDDEVFTVTVYGDKKNDIDAGLTAGTITIDNTILTFSQNVMITATVSGAEGNVSLTDAVTGARTVFSVFVDEDGREILGVVGDVDIQNDEDGDDKDTYSAVFSGTVAVGALVMEAMTVDGDVTVIAEGAELGDVIVNGTLTADNGIAFEMGDVVVYGSLVAAEATEAEAAGSITATGAIYVGLDATDLVKNAAGQLGATASVTGNVTFGMMYVLNGSAVDEDIVRDLPFTRYNVEDALWMTAYKGTGNAAIISVTAAPVENAYFSKWVEELGDTAHAAGNIGAVPDVYAEIDYEVYTIKVIAGNGVGTVAVNGIVMQNYLGNVFKMDGLKAGTYTITYTVKTGYDGTSTMTIDGKVVEDGKIVLSGTPTDADGIEFTVNLSDIDPNYTAPVADDSGMGLTDYLLIILVVLIVVMAIMVALRLMRS